MKNSLFLVLIFLILSFGCSKNKMVTLNGTIETTKDTFLLLTSHHINGMHDTLFAKGGVFSATLQVENPSFQSLTFGKNGRTLFLGPGYDISLAIKGSGLDNTLKIEGKGAKENTILDSISKIRDGFDYAAMYSLSFDSALAFIDSCFTQYFLKFGKMVAFGEIDSIFVKYEKLSLIYDAAGMKTILKFRKNGNDSSYYRSIANVELYNGKYLGIPNYRNFLMYYHDLQVSKRLDKNKKNEDEQYSQVSLPIIRNIPDSMVKEYMMFTDTKHQLENSRIISIDLLYKNYKKYCNDSAYAKTIRNIYNKRLLLAPGKKAPDFECLDIDNTKVATSSFRGKYLYIDFWATWCAPCLEEMPKYIQLQKDYKGENIVFMSVSIDADKEAWRKTVKEHKSEAINLFGGRGLESKAVELYQLRSIPTFVIIDREGNIVDVQAPRPSSNQIRPLLDSLLMLK